MPKSFLENISALGCFEEHPNYPQWETNSVVSLIASLAKGYERHGDSWFDGIEGLMMQCRRKLGDMQELAFDTTWEKAKRGQGNKKEDGVVAVSLDLATYAFLQYMFVSVNERLDSHPEEVDAAQFIRQRQEREMLKKYDKCLRDNHDWEDKGEAMHICKRCGIDLTW